MALANSNRAIGAVSELLKTRLAARTGVGSVLVGRPEAAKTGGANRFNLFLYRVGFDGHMRNVPVDRGQEPPLWLVLHYLLTAFDDKDESDSATAHELLGRGVVALNELNFIRPEVTATALTSNPEPLKLSFDEADAELLSKIMQGTDEKYRISCAFQVRPVMLAVERPPAYAPAVKTVGPPTAEGVVVLPSLGAQLDAVEPERFVVGDTIVLSGTDLAGYDEILLGSTSFPALPAPDGAVHMTLPVATTLAAGAYPVCVGRTLPSGRKRTSNAVLGHLLPIATAANKVAPLSVPAVPTRRFGSFTVAGSQFGGADASIFAALYRDGESKLLLEPQPGGTSTSLSFNVADRQALEQGDYRVILRVNGEQATAAPVLDWT